MTSIDLIGALILLAMVLAAAGLMAWHVGQQRRAINAMDDTEAETPQGVFRRATVLSKKADIQYLNPYAKVPKHRRCFVVTFWVEGAEEAYSVDQELFNRFYEGQTSTLVTVNGNFFSFGEGEPIENSKTGGNDDEI